MSKARKQAQSARHRGRRLTAPPAELYAHDPDQLPLFAEPHPPTVCDSDGHPVHLPAEKPLLGGEHR